MPSTQPAAVSPNADEAVAGTIFNIQRSCTTDGPGLRTTVFIKGCPLRCQWCHNPEGLGRDIEMAYDPERCIGCRACLAACEHGAHEFTDQGQHTRDGARCERCGACVQTCYAGALEAIGQEQTARDVVDTVLLDKPFYTDSGGGVTLSGGEPLYQPEFCAAILRLCRQHRVATALETSLLARREVAELFQPLVDYWMCDVKHIDGPRHRELTGADNRQILANLRQLCEGGATVLARLPLVPGLNDDEAGLEAMGALLAELAPSEGLEILPYHRIGQGKYERVEREYGLADLPEASDDDVRRAAELLRRGGAEGISCQRLRDL